MLFIFLGGIVVKIEVKTISDLTAQEFCQIAQERIKVFVVEQNCSYQEIDELDEAAYHLLLKDDQNNLVGYTRIINKNAKPITFGRVLVPKQYRSHQYGRLLVQATIEKAQELFPNQSIQIQAQAYLENFYHSFGFEPISDVYLEDGIPHLNMKLRVD